MIDYIIPVYFIFSIISIAVFLMIKIWRENQKNSREVDMIFGNAYRLKGKEEEVLECARLILSEAIEIEIERERTNEKV